MVIQQQHLAAFEAFLDVSFAPSTAPDTDDFNIDTSTAGTAIIYPNSYHLRAIASTDVEA